MRENLTESIEEQKARLELRNLKLELYLKPVGLLTPILLTFALFVLIQQPRQKNQDRNQCLNEMRFVEDLALKNEDRTLQAIQKYPFACDAARDFFLIKLDLSYLDIGINGTRNELNTLIDLANNSNFQEINPPIKGLLGNISQKGDIIRRLKYLNEEITNISELKVALDNELAASIDLRDAEAFGLEGLSGVPGRGPKYKAFQEQVRYIQDQSHQLHIVLSALEAEVKAIRALMRSEPALPEFHCDENPNLEGCR